jgi:hypothetical protein
MENKTVTMDYREHEIEEQLKKVFGEDIECHTYEEAWYG